MKKILLCLLMANYTPAFAQYPAIEWQHSYGGSGTDWPMCIIQASGGGYAVAGYTASSNGDVTDHHASDDYWVLNLSPTGGINWSKCLGGTGIDEANSIVQTSDGGYIVAGYSQSVNGDVTDHRGAASYADYWVVKLDASGSIQWSKSYGGSGHDIANCINRTSDGGYIIAGHTGSTDGDVSFLHGNDDVWIVKTDNTGNIQWQKTYGGSANEDAYWVEQTADGGYIAAGFTTSFDGDISGQHGGWDRWIIRLTPTGSLAWQKTLGGTGSEGTFKIHETPDGGFICTGGSESNDGDVSGNHGGLDHWVTKLTSSGALQWQKCYGGSSDDAGGAIELTPDGGYLIAGMAQSTNGDITGHHGLAGTADCWVAKISSTGSLQYSRTLGGIGFDETIAAKPTSDGGCILAAWSQSNDGDVTSNHGDYDYWIVKLKSTTGVGSTERTTSIAISPNPANNFIHLNLSDISSSELSISVYDAVGNCVYREQQKNAELDIDTSQWQEGVYTVIARDMSSVTIREKVAIIK